MSLRQFRPWLSGSEAILIYSETWNLRASATWMFKCPRSWHVWFMNENIINATYLYPVDLECDSLALGTSSVGRLRVLGIRATRNTQTGRIWWKTIRKSQIKTPHHVQNSPHWCASVLRLILKRGLIVIMKTLHTVWYIYIYIIIACFLWLYIMHLQTNTQPNTNDAVKARSNWSFDLLRVEFPGSAKRVFCLNKQQEACCLDNQLDFYVLYSYCIAKATYIYMYTYT